MQKKGFTLIELLAVIVILAVISIIATPIILGIIEDSKKNSFKASSYGISQAAQNAFVKTMYSREETKNIIYTYVDGVESSVPSGYALDYEGSKPANGKVILTLSGKVALALHDGKWCASKDINTAEIIIEEKPLEECKVDMSILYGDYDAEKQVNRPKLTTGMTPIKWNGTTEVITTFDDPEWYDYDAKKWANAKTTDGSYWVWIPRYAYKITSGYHQYVNGSTAGTIDIKFLIDNTNVSVDGTGIADVLNAGETSADIYVKHPAFKFGENELTGIWVAKFEAGAAEGAGSSNYTGSCSVTDNDPTRTVKIAPSIRSWRCMTLANIFTVTMNMKDKKSVYGWDNTDVDTHLMKNTEWGAIAYMSISKYGKQTERVWTNPVTTYFTGCAGSNYYGPNVGSCSYTYITSYGQNASTTGNIYGVYDIVGGAGEYTAAYVDNTIARNSNINLINADSKYKDVYSVGSTDSASDNYNASVALYGDSLYETSLTSGIQSWLQNFSRMPYNTLPWFQRGGHFGDGNFAGPFAFANDLDSLDSGFRPVVLVGKNL